MGLILWPAVRVDVSKNEEESAVLAEITFCWRSWEYMDEEFYYGFYKVEYPVRQFTVKIKRLYKLMKRIRRLN